MAWWRCSTKTSTTTQNSAAAINAPRLTSHTIGPVCHFHPLLDSWLIPALPTMVAKHYAFHSTIDSRISGIDSRTIELWSGYNTNNDAAINRLHFVLL